MHVISSSQKRFIEFENVFISLNNELQVAGLRWIPTGYEWLTSFISNIARRSKPKPFYKGSRD